MNLHVRNNGLHNAYTIVLLWVKNTYSQVLTIGQLAYLDITSTKVNQPNKLKACMPLFYMK